eukprot:snap_masked-scaffold_4-processed-gene-21.33-mRNA-1 protein AED:1.00 eAED:1.00 QI:0/0/0/0/1/1/2/0/65
MALIDSNIRDKMFLLEDNPTSKSICNFIMEWCVHLDFADKFTVITDNASHFSNQLLNTLSRNLRY